MNPVAEKLMSRVRKAECWEWTAGRNSKGYGYITVDGRQRPAHRVSWEVHVGPIPDGLWLDHLCHNRTCVNPSHLRLVTPRQNALENNSGLSAQNANKTHCDKGHEFTPENTLVRRRTGTETARRECRICTRTMQREFMRRKSAKARGLEAALKGDV